MTYQPLRLTTSILLLVCATIVILFPVASAVRGQRVHHRLLKKETQKFDGQGQVVESAFGEDNEPVGFAPLEEEEEREYEEYPDPNDARLDEDEESQEEPEDDEKDDKDNEKDDGVVKLPALLLTLSFGDEAPTSRTTDNGIETLIEEYFENMLSRGFMGPNYISSELEATMFQSQNFATGSQFSFQIEGTALYDESSPVPRAKECKERLVAWFLDWGYGNDLGNFLESNGIQGAKATNLIIGDIQMPAFFQAAIQGSVPAAPSSSSPFPDSNGNSNNIGASNNGYFSSSTPTTSTTTTAPENANSESESKPDKGLIVGLTLFFVCLIVACLLLFSTRRELADECGGCWKTARDKVECCACWKTLRDKVMAPQDNSSKKRSGWRDFEEEGSDTAADQVVAEADKSKSLDHSWMSWRDRSWLDRSWLSKDKSTASKRKWTSWFQPKKKEQEEPSHILSQIQIVVDNDHILKQGDTGYRNYTLPEDCSGAIVSHQHSAATVPHSNFGSIFNEEVSPQKTACPSDEEGSPFPSPMGRWDPPSGSKPKMYPDDEDEVSLPSPVGRWEPPTRSKSKMYRERRNKTSSKGKSRRGAPRSRTRSPQKEAPPPPPPPPPPPEKIQVEVDDDGDCIGLAEWTTYLNPCMLPHLSLFQYENERLDSLVASLPRETSVLDRSEDTTSSASPPPRRQSRTRSRSHGQSRSRSHGKSRSRSHRLQEV